MSAETELTAALQVLRDENQRLRAENERQRTILAQYPEMVTSLTATVRELAAVAPVIQAFMETFQIKQGVEQYTVPQGEDAWRYGYAPPPSETFRPPPMPPVPPPSPVNTTMEAGPQMWQRAQPPMDTGETGITIPDEPAWEG